MVVSGKSSCLGNTQLYGVIGTSKSIQSIAYCAKLLWVNSNLPFNNVIWVNDSFVGKKIISNSKSLLINAYLSDGIPQTPTGNVALLTLLKN